MPSAGHFGKMGGYFLIGVAAVILTALVMSLLLPFIGLLFIGLLGAFVIVLVSILMFAFIYIALFIGVGLRYLFKPMKAERKDRRYTIKRVRESGRREEGKS